MITRQNLTDVLKSIRPQDKKRIFNTDKEYCVIYLNTYNSGHSVDITLTNDHNRYKNVSNDGNCILEIDDILERLKKATPIFKHYNTIHNLCWDSCFISDIEMNKAGQFFIEINPDIEEIESTKQLLLSNGIESAISKLGTRLFVF